MRARLKTPGKSGVSFEKLKERACTAKWILCLLGRDRKWVTGGYGILFRDSRSFRRRRPGYSVSTHGRQPRTWTFLFRGRVGLISLRALESIRRQKISRNYPSNLKLVAAGVLAIKAFRRSVVGGAGQAASLGELNGQIFEVSKSVDLPGQVIEPDRRSAGW